MIARGKGVRNDADGRHGRTRTGAPVRRATLLALVAGYADTIGYVSFHAFAGLMTGNTIFLGIEAATGEFQRAGFHGLIILVFLLGVVAGRLKVRAGVPVWLALTVPSMLMVACSFAEEFWGAVLLALAMGVQNSAANRFDGVALNTVFITGNLQKLGEELVAWLWPSGPGVARQGVSIFAGVWAAYAVGAGLGALAVGAMAKPLLVPAVLLPFIMLRAPAARAA